MPFLRKCVWLLWFDYIILLSPELNCQVTFEHSWQGLLLTVKAVYTSIAIRNLFSKQSNTPSTYPLILNLYWTLCLFKNFFIVEYGEMYMCWFLNKNWLCHGFFQSLSVPISRVCAACLFHKCFMSVWANKNISNT